MAFGSLLAGAGLSLVGGMLKGKAAKKQLAAQQAAMDEQTRVSGAEYDTRDNISRTVRDDIYDVSRRGLRESTDFRKKTFDEDLAAGDERFKGEEGSFRSRFREDEDAAGSRFAGDEGSSEARFRGNLGSRRRGFSERLGINTRADEAGTRRQLTGERDLAAIRGQRDMSKISSRLREGDASSAEQGRQRAFSGQADSAFSSGIPLIGRAGFDASQASALGRRIAGVNAAISTPATAPTLGNTGSAFQAELAKQTGEAVGGARTFAEGLAGSESYGDAVDAGDRSLTRLSDRLRQVGFKSGESAGAYDKELAAARLEGTLAGDRATRRRAKSVRDVNRFLELLGKERDDAIDLSTTTQSERDSTRNAAFDAEDDVRTDYFNRTDASRKRYYDDTDEARTGLFDATDAARGQRNSDIAGAMSDYYSGKINNRQGYLRTRLGASQDYENEMGNLADKKIGSTTASSPLGNALSAAGSSLVSSSLGKFGDTVGTKLDAFIKSKLPTRK